MRTLENRVLDVLSGKKRELLWILEHNTVYTAGKSSNKKDILDKKLKVLKTNRGGKITIHSPGQKVVYFVLNLNQREKDIRKLVTNIETCIIDTLKEYKVKSFSDKKNIGIWISKNNKIFKIASIGIRVKRWVAYHGFSLNVENDLSKYKKIVPCGIKDISVTNLKSLGIKNYQNVNKIIIKKFLNTFHLKNS
jgi:lipoyl(octanoyl) transferase